MVADSAPSMMAERGEDWERRDDMGSFSSTGTRGMTMEDTAKEETTNKSNRRCRVE